MADNDQSAWIYRVPSIAKAIEEGMLTKKAVWDMYCGALFTSSPTLDREQEFPGGTLKVQRKPGGGDWQLSVWFEPKVNTEEVEAQA